MNPDVMRSQLRDIIQNASKALEGDQDADIVKAWAILRQGVDGASSNLPVTFVSSQPLHEAARVLEEVINAPSPAPQLTSDLQAYPELKDLHANLLKLRQFLLALVNGDLSQELRLAGYLAGSLKSLQANLRHLTWQTKMIASGDFSQRVDFMGEFSEAFNAMVVQLDESLQAIKTRDAALTRINMELRASEEKYRMVGEYNYDWEYWISPTGTLIYVSPSCQRITGFTPEEFIANPRLIMAIVHPENQEMMAAHLHESTQGLLAVCELEFRIITKDGEERWLRHVCQSVYRDQNIWMGRRASNQDITQRKHAEETLRSTRDYLENIIANSADSIGIVDRQSKFIRWNKVAEEIYGYTYEELKGKSAFDLYADSGELDVMLKQLRQHGFITNYEISMKKKGGSVFPANLSIRLLRNNANEVIGSITGCRDLTEIRHIMTQLQKEIYQHEQARQALLESEQKLLSIIDLLPDATFVIDIKSRVIAWNKAIEDMTGIKAQDMLGKGNYEYALPFYEERRPILIDLVLEPEKGIDRYIDVKKEDRSLVAIAHLANFRGKETYLFGKASALIDSHGNIFGSIESIRDITALRKSEEERLRFSKLESLSTLTGGIAHDFNNIIAAIMGYIELAQMDNKLGERTQKRLEQAEKGCHLARDLTKKLLTFAKGGAPVKKPMFISQLLNEAAQLVLTGSNVKGEIDIPQDLWPVEGDAAQITQVMHNIIINAQQAMPDGGKIQISAENTILEDDSELPLTSGKYVRVAIADQGEGIPPENLRRIFDPYFSTKARGSGLGLGAAYSIIKGHGGYLTVDSKMGAGSTFIFYLPASGKTVQPQEEPAEELVPGQGRILVMDDEQMILDFLQQMLSQIGYEVECARDGHEAIALYEAAKCSGRTFAAVIMDLTIPGGMGGKEAIKFLLGLDPHCKAIVSSGYSDDPIMADSQKYGFSGAIDKPYKVSRLSKILHEVISKNI